MQKKIDYFTAGPCTEVNIVASAGTTLKIPDGYSDMFTGIGFFKGSFSLQVKDQINP